MANRSGLISRTDRVICRSRTSGDAVTSTRTGAMRVALLRYVRGGTCIGAPTAEEEQWAWASSSAACVVLSALVTVRDGASSVAEDIVLRRRKKLVPVHASTGYVHVAGWSMMMVGWWGVGWWHVGSGQSCNHIHARVNVLPKNDLHNSPNDRHQSGFAFTAGCEGSRS